MTRVARGLPAALAKGGGRVGVSKPSEAASEAVAHLAPPPRGADGLQFNEIGGAFGGAGAPIGGGYGAAAGGDGDAEDAAEAAATARATRAAKKDARARADLFARPAAKGKAEEEEGGGEGEEEEEGGGGPVTAAAPGGHGDEDEGGEDGGGFGDGAPDIDAAFRDGSGGVEGEEVVLDDENGLM